MNLARFPCRKRLAESKSKPSANRNNRSDDQMDVPPGKSPLKFLIRHTWRLIVAVVGGTVVLLGGIMLFTPGPAMLVIPLGLAILAIEFVWAKRLLRRIKVTAKWKLRRLKNVTNPVRESEMEKHDKNRPVDPDAKDNCRSH